jgi:hypothetical protein
LRVLGLIVYSGLDTLTIFMESVGKDLELGSLLQNSAFCGQAVKDYSCCCKAYNA